MASIRSFHLARGTLLQSGADAAKPYYNDPGIVIVNVAPRTGTAERRDGGALRNIAGGQQVTSPPATVYWLPMVESRRHKASTEYLARFGSDLLAHLSAGGTVVVHCQEGVYRSVAFAEQLQALATGSSIAIREHTEEAVDEEDEEDAPHVAAGAPGRGGHRHRCEVS